MNVRCCEYNTGEGLPLLATAAHYTHSAVIHQCSPKLELDLLRSSTLSLDEDGYCSQYMYNFNERF